MTMPRMRARAAARSSLVVPTAPRRPTRATVAAPATGPRRSGQKEQSARGDRDRECARRERARGEDAPANQLNTSLKRWLIADVPPQPGSLMECNEPPSSTVFWVLS